MTTTLAHPDDDRPRTPAERLEAARGAEMIADEMERRGVATFGELLDQLRADPERTATTRSGT